MTTKYRNEELIAKARAGCEESKSQLFLANEKFTYHIARRFYYTGIELDDLASIAMVGMVKAYNSFDETRGLKFVTLAAKCMTNEILMTLRKENKRVNDVSLDATLFIGDDGSEVSLVDSLHSPSSLDIDSFVETESLSSVVEATLKSINSPRWKQIFELHYLSGWTQKRISEEIGFSQSYISRIITQLEKKLQRTALRLHFVEEIPMRKQAIEDEQFKYVRDVAGLNEKDMAEFFGVSITTIKNYLKRLESHKLFTLDSLEKQALGLKVSDFKYRKRRDRITEIKLGVSGNQEVQNEVNGCIPLTPAVTSTSTSKADMESAPDIPSWYERLEAQSPNEDDFNEDTPARAMPSPQPRTMLTGDGNDVGNLTEFRVTLTHANADAVREMLKTANSVLNSDKSNYGLTITIRQG